MPYTALTTQIVTETKVLPEDIQFHKFQISKYLYLFRISGHTCYISVRLWVHNFILVTETHIPMDVVFYTKPPDSFKGW
jgi:hypothetical protein